MQVSTLAIVAGELNIGAAIVADERGRTVLRHTADGETFDFWFEKGPGPRRGDRKVRGETVMTRAILCGRHTDGAGEEFPINVPPVTIRPGVRYYEAIVDSLLTAIAGQKAEAGWHGAFDVVDHARAPR